VQRSIYSVCIDERSAAQRWAKKYWYILSSLYPTPARSSSYLEAGTHKTARADTH
jgi:hypothetical protein